ncbi:MAG: SDR family oxidoreductase [Chloroflexota bacterium]
MGSVHQRIVLVTGASSGIGRACAQHLCHKGYRVYGTSRRAPWPEGNPQASTPTMIPMDVTSDESVAQAVAWIMAREQRLDVVVNCAGYSLSGGVEDTSLEEARAEFETNFFGAVRVSRQVLPVMRRQESGYLVHIGSLAGLLGIPFQGFYSASKFALDGLMEALRAEVSPYGVQVVLIVPGDFYTGFTANRIEAQAAQAGKSAYAGNYAKALKVMVNDEIHGHAPERIARLLERIITTRSPRLRYITGPLAEQFLVALKKVLPERLFGWLLVKYYQIS